jgi:hypothetical protein
MVGSPDDDLVTTESFLRHVTRVLEGGSATSTLKWALLIGLIESAPLFAGDEEISLGPVADVVVRLYKRHAIPYPPIGHRLRQTVGGRDDLSLFTDLEVFGAGSTIRTKVAWNLAQWPVPRLQLVNGVAAPLLFRDQEMWSERLSGKGSNRPLPMKLFAKDAEGLPVLAVLPGALDALLRVGPLLREVIEVRWALQVAGINKIGDDPKLALLRFLFPSADRRAFSEELREDLRELQSGVCLWCQSALPAKGAVVDHVVPWSFSRNDAVENLLACHQVCNSTKSDLLLHPTLSRRWVQFIQKHEQKLCDLASKHSLATDPALSLAWLRGQYRIVVDLPSWKGFHASGGSLLVFNGDAELAEAMLIELD